tara:strand:- start:1712 stop:2263 length:552 start_codon:yes stop_codon:yes gene_type:complete
MPSIISQTDTPVRFGPSGRAMSQKIEDNLLENFYLHINLERTASINYLSMSLWFEQIDLRGFAEFFYKESINENKHSYRFCKYLISRGYSVVLHDLPSPRDKWDSIEEVISDSFLMESDLTTSIHQLYSFAERSSDERTNVFLDPFIEDQIKSEDEFAHILGKVRFSKNDPSSIMLIDNNLIS